MNYSKLLNTFIFTFAICILELYTHANPLSFEKQLKSSEGVILGQFLGSNSKRLRDGKIVTEVNFKVVKSVGIDQRFMLNTNFFKFYFDGGVWNGVEVRNLNKPLFQKDSDYVVLLEKTSFGFKLHNDKSGVYDLIENARESSVVSQAFPTHPEYGSASIDQFNLWVRIVHGNYLEEIHSDRYIHRGKKRDGRAPASLTEKQSEKKSSIHIIWYAVLLGVFGALHIRSRKSANS